MNGEAYHDGCEVRNKRMASGCGVKVDSLEDTPKPYCILRNEAMESKQISLHVETVS